jgi:hypothetical protein
MVTCTDRRGSTGDGIGEGSDSCNKSCVSLEALAWYPKITVVVDRSIIYMKSGSGATDVHEIWY